VALAIAAVAALAAMRRRELAGAALMVAAFLAGHRLFPSLYLLLPARLFPVPFRVLRAARLTRSLSAHQAYGGAVASDSTRVLETFWRGHRARNDDVYWWMDGHVGFRACLRRGVYSSLSAL
jgi:hypothetical protein